MDICRIEAEDRHFSALYREEKERGIFIRNNFTNDFIDFCTAQYLCNVSLHSECAVP